MKILKQGFSIYLSIVKISKCAGECGGEERRSERRYIENYCRERLSEVPNSPIIILFMAPSSLIISPGARWQPLALKAKRDNCVSWFPWVLSATHSDIYYIVPVSSLLLLLFRRDSLSVSLLYIHT